MVEGDGGEKRRREEIKAKAERLAKMERDQAERRAQRRAARAQRSFCGRGATTRAGSC